MFTKILIANRGEIACRAIKTARKLDIKTVAVYSEADRDALHARLADEAVFIGPPPAAESYLLIDKIIDACKQTDSEAVFPGYGFLSENAEFVRRLAENNIEFIGPGTKAIEAMGDKIQSKQIAEQAGVNTIPGFTEAITDAQHAVSVACDIGYPVMLKATAGGGGKGMRIVRDDDECREGFERATSEARSSFGDDRVFAEKYIEEPRHIEIQIVSDRHGNVVYLQERECSIQRRHQKVIEEAPSPFIDEATRQAMGEQAIALARAVDYESAGTVEFIVDNQRNFYFLEMNTRLQVEHPVTELITGIDLVEWMIDVAGGAELPMEQNDIPMNGWAMESRIYAENPYRNFLPSTGRLVRYVAPEESESVRVDTGVVEGGEVSIYYDPMIAKLVTHGVDRNQAIQTMQQALNQYYIRGVETNIPFVASVMAHQRFNEGRLSTNFIDQEYPDGFHTADALHDDPVELAAVAASIHRSYMDRAAGTSGQLKGHERVVDAEYVVRIDTHSVEVSVHPAENGHEVTCDGKTLTVASDWQFG
ncbi:MAG: acetyl-CoA carboxylase biotin carboxylase subunit, partial [Gammaproteobacteria bacterium]|nr:acetyl-CoA carboxylase biotin carboxylase subunit [Gammaproteobacteria bacterium]